jgi:hypothetical protein
MLINLLRAQPVKVVLASPGTEIGSGASPIHNNSRTYTNKTHSVAISRQRSHLLLFGDINVLDEENAGPSSRGKHGGRGGRGGGASGGRGGGSGGRRNPKLRSVDPAGNVTYSSATVLREALADFVASGRVATIKAA